MQIEQLYELFLNSNGVCTDTRNIISGSIFFALKGARFNGNKFSNEAIAAGCRLAVADEEPSRPDEKIVVVKDALETLQQLATHHRNQCGAVIIGLTGSNGKTTTKELIHAVLHKKFNVHATKGNLNNHIGVPLTLLSTPSGTEIAIIEMGANKPNDIKELCEIADPDYGCITNIGDAHLEGFGSREGVIRAKSQLYDHIRKKQGMVFVHASDDVVSELSRDIEAFTYSTDHTTADINGQPIPNGLRLSLKWKSPNDDEQHVRTRLAGGYNLPNILAAVAIGKYFGVASNDISSALADYEPQNNRSQIQESARNNILLDAYNANPSSVSAALNDFSRAPGNNKFLILGDMLEIGTQSLSAHQAVLQEIAKMNLPGIVIGDEFQKALKSSPVDDIEGFGSTEEADQYLQKIHLEGYYILIKGSRGMQLEKLVPALTS